MIAINKNQATKKLSLFWWSIPIYIILKVSLQYLLVERISSDISVILFLAFLIVSPFVLLLILAKTGTKRQWLILAGIVAGYLSSLVLSGGEEVFGFYFPYIIGVIYLAASMILCLPLWALKNRFPDFVKSFLYTFIPLALWFSVFLQLPYSYQINYATPYIFLELFL